MDYKQLIHSIVDSFISDPEALLIREVQDDNEKSDLTFLICAPSQDIARLIGKKDASLIQLEISFLSLVS